MPMRTCPVCEGQKYRLITVDELKKRIVWCDLCKGEGKIEDNRPKK